MNTLKKQSGVMLLEAMIAILIFSIGILAVIALQAAAVKASSDAQYRSEASLLVNELVGQMRTSDRTPATLKSNFQGGGVYYTAWKAKVEATLPLVAANPPTVVVNVIPGLVLPTSMATITVFWQLPGQVEVHQYSTIVQVI